MKSFFLFGFLFFAQTISAQKDSSSNKNAVYIELMGIGGAYSINYDRILSQFSPSVKFAGRLGYSYYGAKLWQTQYSIHNLMVEFNLLVGKKPLQFETGFGYMRTLNQKEQVPLYMQGNPGGYNFVTYNSFSVRLGMRHQKPGKRFLFRLAFTPLYIETDLYYPAQYMLQPWGATSIGYSF